MWQSVLRSPWFVLMVMGAPLIGATSIGAPGRAQSWSDIGDYSSLLRRAGTQTLVAKDCPSGLLGAFHSGRNALLLCSNNLQDDPAHVWTVLAHESAHVMQSCNGGNLMPAPLLAKNMEEARRLEPDTFHELQLYHTSQHHVEAEARLVQALPPTQVVALFEKHCATRLSP